MLLFVYTQTEDFKSSIITNNNCSINYFSKNFNYEINNINEVNQYKY